MSTPYGFGSGALQGLAEAYAYRKRIDLEDEMNRRHAALTTLGGLMTNARPEAQVQLAQKMAGLIATPIHKKLDKNILDLSDVLQAPPGSPGAQPPQPINVGGESLAGSVGEAPPSSGFSAAPLAGAGMPGVAGFPAGGPSSGASRVPNDVQAPPVNMSAAPSGPGMTIGQTPGISPPPYSPWYSPEEQAQLKAHEASMAAEGTVRSQIEARRKIGEDMGLKDADLARFSLGTAPYLIHYQKGTFQDPSDPNKAISLSFDPVNNVYMNDAGEVVPNPQPWTGSPTRLGDVVPMAESNTGWGRKIYGRNGEVTRVEPGAAPPASYAPSYSATTSPGVSIDPGTGLVVSTPQTRGSVNQRGIPGQPAPNLTPPPATVGAPTTIGSARVPKTVIDAQQEVNTANQRLDIMTQLEKRAKAQDQQAQIAILAAHMGMTAGIVPGVRIGATFWNEAEESAPWITRILAGITKIDPQTGERVVTSPLTGIKLASEQIDQMIDLARTGVQVAGKNLNTVKANVQSGYGILPPPPAPAANSATKAQVQAYANKFKLSYAAAKKEFEDDGLTVNEGR